jgi:hypothetical protein
LLETQLDELPGHIDSRDQMSMEGVLAALVRAREIGLVALSQRIGELTDADIEAIESVISSPPDPLCYVQNEHELGAWRELLSLAFEKDSDISAAARKVVTAHERGTPSATLSIRDVAARIRSERTEILRATARSRSGGSDRGKRSPRSQRR